MSIPGRGITWVIKSGYLFTVFSIIIENTVNLYYKIKQHESRNSWRRIRRFKTGKKTE